MFSRSTPSESSIAMTLRRGTAFTIRNFLVTGFKTSGPQVETSNTATTAQIDNGTSQMGAGVIWSIGAGTAAAAVHSSIAAYVNNGRFPSIRINEDPGVSTTGCANHENPNFQPSGVATLAGGQLAPIQPPNDGFFETVTFIGAVPPAPADNWMTGWTSFPQR